MTDVVVKLSQRYKDEFGGADFDSVTLREPTYQDVFSRGLGPPYELQPNGTGGAMVVMHYTIIRDYIDKLVIKPDAGALVVLNARDSMALSKAVTDFFTEPTESSSTPTG